MESRVLHEFFCLRDKVQRLFVFGYNNFLQFINLGERELIVIPIEKVIDTLAYGLFSHFTFNGRELENHFMSVVYFVMFTIYKFIKTFPQKIFFPKYFLRFIDIVEKYSLLCHPSTIIMLIDFYSKRYSGYFISHTNKASSAIQGITRLVISIFFVRKKSCFCSGF